MSDKFKDILISIIVITWFLTSILLFPYFSYIGNNNYLLIDMGQFFAIPGFLGFYFDRESKGKYVGLTFFIIGLLLIVLNTIDVNKYINFDIIHRIFSERNIAYILLFIFIIYILFIIKCFISFINSIKVFYRIVCDCDKYYYVYEIDGREYKYLSNLVKENTIKELNEKSSLNSFSGYIYISKNDYEKRLPFYIPMIFMTVPFVIFFIFVPAYIILFF